MLKPAMFAAAVLACAPLVLASTPEPQAADIACRATNTSGPACALRIADPVDALVPPDASPGALADLPEAGAPASTAIDFKDAALAPAILASTRDRSDDKRLLPALFALLAMVILLRRRPGVF